MPLARYNYKCLNPDCDHQGFQVIQKEESQIAKPEYCESCYSPIKLMGELISGGLTMNFRNSSPAKRKEMLMQRSKKHFASTDLAAKKRDIGERYKKEVLQNLKDR